LEAHSDTLKKERDREIRVHLLSERKRLDCVVQRTKSASACLQGKRIQAGKELDKLNNAASSILVEQTAEETRLNEAMKKLLEERENVRRYFLVKLAQIDEEKDRIIITHNQIESEIAEKQAEAKKSEDALKEIEHALDLHRSNSTNESIATGADSFSPFSAKWGNSPEHKIEAKAQSRSPSPQARSASPNGRLIVLQQESETMAGKVSPVYAAATSTSTGLIMPTFLSRNTSLVSQDLRQPPLIHERQIPSRHVSPGQRTPTATPRLPVHQYPIVQSGHQHHAMPPLLSWGSCHSQSLPTTAVHRTQHYTVQATPITNGTQSFISNGGSHSLATRPTFASTTSI
jgi:hypothetical protein